MQRKAHFTLITSLLLIFLLLIQCSPQKKDIQETSQQRPDFAKITPLTESWRAKKISLFIHFGVYSSLGGKWKGKDINGPSENIQAIAGMGADEYQQTAASFSPKKWHPEDIIALAKDIGAKNIVYTVKHHDGFCLFKTETTPFNIVDFTPFNKDLLADLSNACKNAKIDLSLNYSLTDWHLPAAWPITSRNGAPITQEHHNTNLQQLKELLTNYGKISSIYFYSGLPTPEQSKEMRDLIHELQPQCLISNGIGNNMGDFIAMPFNQPLDIIPETPWIYRSSLFPPSLGFDKNKKVLDPLQTAKDKIRELVNVISSGGNYAINLAPRGDGSIDPQELEILSHMGRWIKVNAQALSQTHTNPIEIQSRFWSATCNKNLLYLFVDSVPASQKIILPGLNTTVKSIKFLGSGIEPEFLNKAQQLEILWTSPAMADPMQLPVLEIVMNSPLHPSPGKFLSAGPNDTIWLNQSNAIPSNSITGFDQLSSIPSKTSLKWNLKVQQPLMATLKFSEYEAGKSLIIETDSSKNNVLLKGKVGDFIRSVADTIQQKSIFRSSPFYGPFDKLHINPRGDNRLQISRGSWKGLSQNGEKTIPLPLTNFYYYIEIISESAQQYCFKITGNDGIQLWNNNKELLKQVNPHVDQPLVCQIVLDLNQGINILLVRNFNRWGNKDQFSLTPLPDARWLTQPLNLPDNLQYIKVERASPANPHADIDLPNFSIELVTKN